MTNTNQSVEIEDGSNDKKYFTIIPNYILNHSTPYDRDVYIQMKRIAGEHGTCWTSQKTLAKQCGVSINRLKKSLSYLLDNKWIKYMGTKKVGTKGGGQEVNEYKIVDLWKMNGEFYEIKGVSPDDIPAKQGVSLIEPRECHKKIRGVSLDDNKEEPINNKPIKEEAGDKENLIKEVVEKWNSYAKPLEGYRNKTLNKFGLPKCKGITADIRVVFYRLMKEKRTKEAMLESIKNYMNEVINRSPDNDYAIHRFSFYEFFNQDNGFVKFSNK